MGPSPVRDGTLTQVGLSGLTEPLSKDFPLAGCRARLLAAALVPQCPSGLSSDSESPRATCAPGHRAIMIRVGRGGRGGPGPAGPHRPAAATFRHYEHAHLPSTRNIEKLPLPIRGSMLLFSVELNPAQI